MRATFGVLDRRTMPNTWYPLSSSSSARYEPSCPVMPVINARLRMLLFFSVRRPRGYRRALRCRTSNCKEPLRQGQQRFQLQSPRMIEESRRLDVAQTAEDANRRYNDALTALDR